MSAIAKTKTVRVLVSPGSKGTAVENLDCKKENKEPH